VVGYLDEVWWSRLAQPTLRTWIDEGAVKLVQLDGEKEDTEPKAIACYGILRGDTHAMLLRFVEGRPVSAVTIDFLAWTCERLAKEGKTALLLVADNASWHVSGIVREWIRSHNRQVKAPGGVRIVLCLLPVKSPWLNAIEAKWVHGKRAIAEPDRKLTAQEMKERIVAYYGWDHEPPLIQPVVLKAPSKRQRAHPASQTVS